MDDILKGEIRFKEKPRSSVHFTQSRFDTATLETKFVKLSSDLHTGEPLVPQGLTLLSLSTIFLPDPN